MKKTILLPILVICLALWGTAQDEIQLVQLASGFNTPVDIASAGDDRLFIVEKRGIIRIMDTTGQVMQTPFLDIDSRVNSGSSERGLLGLAFHPNYTENGYLFVNYTGQDGSTVIERYTRDSTNADIADPASRKTLLGIGQPFSNHNAGQVAFGPDGYLYIGTGDGGSGGDPGNRSQNPLNLLGKMLRIDVDNGDPYGIPPDNPFAETDAVLDEIWSIGLRNPWRYSFDTETGALFIADVGQNAFEEVNYEPAGTAGGLNYGWRCYEANATFNTGGCPPQDSFTAPVFSYAHVGLNCAGSVTGGFVYRGSRYPQLYGTYIMTDYCKGVFRGFEMDTSGQAVNARVLAEMDPFQYTSFGQDAAGELYVAGGGGTIYKLEASPVSSTRDLDAGDWRVYPVPASSNVTFSKLTNQPPSKVEISLYNAVGVKVLNSALDPSGQLSLNGLSPGLYLAYLTEGKKEYLLRLVVQ